MKTCLLCLLTLAMPVSAVESWQPHQHPAMVERSITAFTRPSRTLILSAEFAGVVMQLAPEEGALIPPESGPIVRIDNTLALLSRTRAVSAIDSAQARIEQVEALVALREREQLYRETEAERVSALVAQNRISESERDARVFAADTAAHQVSIERANLAAARSALIEAQAALAEIDERIRRHDIHGPGGWRVAERLVEPGAYVNPGQPLVRLVDDHELAIELTLTQTELTALGTTIPLRIIATGTTVTATLHHVSPEFDPVTTKRRVELRVPASDALASAGIEVEVRLAIPDPRGSVLIPLTLIRERLEQSSVIDNAGGEHLVRVLARNQGMAIVDSRSLPPAVTLVAPGEAN